MRQFFLYITCLLTFSIMGQGNFILQEKEDILVNLLTKMRDVKENDELLIQLNDEFQAKFLEALSLNESFDYPFSGLQTVGKIYSQDQLVRVITWNIQMNDFSHDYFGFVMKRNEKNGKSTVVPLTRQKQNLYFIQDDRLDADNWYGALYYDIIDVKKKNKIYYTILGYDANTDRSTYKIIDVMTFAGKNPRFGAPIFEISRGITSRVIFEYSARATMSVRYDVSRDKIIFDHLSPESSTLKDFREFYVPDLSYDAYVWNGKVWELEEDVIAVNNEDNETFFSAYDKNTGSDVKIRVKNEWINPEDPDAPLDGGKHQAMTPDDVVKPAKKEKDKKKQKKEEESIDFDKGNHIPGVTGYDKKKK